MALATWVVAACSGAAPPPERSAARAPRAAASESPGTAGPPALASTLLTTVPQGTFGPYLGTRRGASIAVWAAEEQGKRRWATLSLGAPSPGKPRVVADAAAEVDLVAVRPAGASGFLLVSTSREFSGARIDALGLGAQGELRGGPTPLAQGLPVVVWIDSVPTKDGALVLWAVRREDRADVFGMELGETGEPKDSSTLLVEGARAWQVAPLLDGAAIAAVTAGKARGERGPLRLVFVDPHGHVDRKVTLVEAPTAEPDVDLIRLGERLLVAWSDRSGLDPRLHTAIVDAAGNVVQGKTQVTDPMGPQALVRLVPPFEAAGTAYLVWENLLERSGTTRFLRVATVAPSGAVSPASASLLLGPGGAIPEIAAGPSGLSVITMAPPCERGSSGCGASPVPTYVGLDRTLRAVAAEPLRLTSTGHRAVELAWGLSCSSAGCTTLAAGPGDPAPIHAVKLEARSDRWEPPVRKQDDAVQPRVTALQALSRSEPVADLAVAKVGPSDLLAWVTYLDPATPIVRAKTPAPDGKYEAPRALLRVQSLAPGAPEPTVLSYRGHSLGGVALAPGDPGKQEALLVWTGIDAGQPQVFLTLLGPGGKKILQKMLTRGKGGASDVAAAFTGDGWVVAWTDERGATPQIRLAKVDRTLKPVVTERRLSGAASVQTGAQLLVRGDHLLAVWSDARGRSAGVADVYAMRLSTRDLSSIGPEHVLAATPSHSRTPSLGAFGEGAVVVWIEESPAGGEGAAASVAVQRLDSGGEPLGALSMLRFDGSPETARVDCQNGGCRLASSVDTDEGGAVDIALWSPEGIREPVRLVALGGKGGVAPLAFAGGDLVCTDELRPGDVRIRRIGLAWK